VEAGKNRGDLPGNEGLFRSAGDDGSAAEERRGERSIDKGEGGPGAWRTEFAGLFAGAGRLEIEPRNSIFVKKAKAIFDVEIFCVGYIEDGWLQKAGFTTA
jgi:hypothetical protein